MSPSTAPASPSTSTNAGRGAPRGRATPALYTLAVLAVLAEFVGMGAWVRWRFMRFEIRGESMSPALEEGDWVIVDRGPLRHYRPHPRHIVLARDPREPQRLLVKRVDHIDLHGQVWLLGDNAPASTDSRVFGAVAPDTILGRVRWRYWPVSAWFRIG